VLAACFARRDSAVLSAGCIGVAGGVLGFGVFGVTHLLGSRAGVTNARLLGLAFPLSALGAALLASALAIRFGLPGSYLLAAVLAILVEVSLFVLYAPALYVVLTSQSVETMIWLRAQGGRISETALCERFAGRAVIDDRLATLEASGYLLRDGEILRLTQRGLTTARIFKSIGDLWKLGAGG
jgi:hypothetical protein